ncbi:restriction endonuclease subunit S [Streptococcus sp. S784/96/1]|uniref:restriction endonuclease subunit S n=1 Tax=Streptococcus sp. S784/96/1 TaxID=2653499 RepID=UPI00192E52C5|nr:restriction endonuclease subunit S [Streptococcus sp. S784/96/1]
MQNKKIPKIRFRNFRDKWNFKHLSNLVDKVKEKNKENFYSETLTNSAEFGIVNQREFFDKDISNEKNLDGYYVVRPDDFVYNPRISNLAPVGPIKRNKLNRIGVMSPLYFVFRVKENQHVDLDYLDTFFQSNHWHKFMKQNGDSGARADRFAIKDSVFVTMPIPFPSLPEQSAIGSLFQTLDELLSAYKDNLANYQAFKVSMLSKMFPKAGQTTPEIRLDGFEDEWEEMKLKELANYVRGSFPQPYTNKEFYDEVHGMPFVQVSDIGYNLKINDDTKLHISKIAEPKSRFVKSGTVIVALQGSIETSIGRTAITHYDAYVDRTILIFESYKLPINRMYFAQVIKSLFQKEKERAWGATISTITKQHLNDFIISIPSLPEQQAIGSFFSNLDDLISSYQEKVAQLETLKKKLLQDMFV